MPSRNAVTFSGNPSLFVREPRRQLQRRQARRMQDLVRVGVPDAAEEPRVGEGALEGVALTRERFPKGGEIGLEHLETPAVERGEGARAPRQVDGGAPLLARLGEEQRAVGEVESGETVAARDRRAVRLPPQPPRDHEVQHDEVVVVETERDALAEPTELLHHAPRHVGDRGIDGPQQEGARDPERLERAAHHARSQRFQIDDDVRQLGHPTPSRRTQSPRATGP